MNTSISYFLPTLPDPALREPITFSGVAPLFACYYALALLVQLPRTLIFRLSLLPFAIWSGWYAATRYDLALRIAMMLGWEDHWQIQGLNFALVSGIMQLCLRSMEWAFATKPYRRLHSKEASSEPTPTDDAALSPLQLLKDTIALTNNHRGIGWSWARNPFPEVPPRSLTRLTLTLLLKASLCDIAYFSAVYLCPGINSPDGDTIFDASLPLLARYARAVLITLLVGVLSYTAVDTGYLAAAVPSCLFLGQSTSQWPPPSNRPWLSTSISEFWGKRYHRFFRQIFVAVGSRPLSAIFGKPGAVIGAFAVSALVHDWGLYGLGKGTEFGTVGMFFVMMGVGILLEGVWEEGFGMGKVRGWKGWVWTMVWTIGWGMRMVDAWARKGLLVINLVPEESRIGHIVVSGVVRLVEWIARYS